jgi:hypothetical protein
MTVVNKTYTLCHYNIHSCKKKIYLKVYHICRYQTNIAIQLWYNRRINVRYNIGRLLGNKYWELDENADTWNKTLGFAEDRDEVDSLSNGHVRTEIGVFSQNPRKRRKYTEIEETSPKNRQNYTLLSKLWVMAEEMWGDRIKDGDINEVRTA